MHLHLTAPDATPAALAFVAALTDQARLDPRTVRYGDAFVSFDVTRFPLLQQRAVLGHRHDHRTPIRTRVTVRRATGYDVEDHTPPGETTVIVLFGLTAGDGEICVSSAEEERGTTLFTLRIAVEEIDIELTDENDAMTPPA